MAKGLNKMREAVKERGPEAWKRFVATREALKNVGHPSVEAWYIAYHQTVGDHPSPEAAVLAALHDMEANGSLGRSLGAKRRKAAEGTIASTVARHSRRASNERAAEVLRLSRTALDVHKGAELVIAGENAQAEFVLDGHKLRLDDTPAEAVLWVARNARLTGPDMATCPGAIAYGMWMWVREDPSNAREFWKVLTQKTVQGMDQDSGGDEAAELPLRALIEKLTGKSAAPDTQSTHTQEV